MKHEKLNEKHKKEILNKLKLSEVMMKIKKVSIDLLHIWERTGYDYGEVYKINVLSKLEEQQKFYILLS